jgi:predicted metal-dependent HD superfamily phosphohydrolase
VDTAERRLNLAARFSTLMRRLGATRQVDELSAALEAAWGEPHRAYHGTTHLVDCLEQLDSAPGEGADRRVVEAALWFHDAVYDPRATGNETRSAAWAARGLTDAGVPHGISAEVARLVLLTRHSAPAADPAGRLVCDVDLSILGREPDRFAEFERRIRAEYSWVAEDIYRAVRADILEGFLRRSPLFLTAHFRGKYEARARRNLEDTIARLRAPLPGGGPAAMGS